MTSREIVKRAIHFQNPPRIPYNYDSNRSSYTEHTYGDDFIWCFLDRIEPQKYDADGNEIDEWGNVWETIDDSFGETKYHVYEGLEEYAHLPIPDFLNPARYETMKKIAQENKGEKYLMAYMPLGIFQMQINIFGFEGFMLELAGNTEEFCAFLDKLCDTCIGVIERVAEAGMDGIIICEDMGLQDRTMISPKMWSEIYAPRFKRIFDAAHSHGLDVLSHTCGHIVDILDEYIACGVDVIQIDQQLNMGLELLSERFAGKVCFFCPADIQRTITMSREEMFEYCDKLVRLLGRENGGFMAKTYPQPIAIGITPENMQNMADAFAAASKKYYGE